MRILILAKGFAEKATDGVTTLIHQLGGLFPAPVAIAIPVETNGTRSRRSAAYPLMRNASQLGDARRPWTPGGPMYRQDHRRF